MRGWCASLTCQRRNAWPLMPEVLDRHQQALETQAIITIRRGRIRISRAPSS